MELAGSSKSGDRQCCPIEMNPQHYKLQVDIVSEQAWEQQQQQNATDTHILTSCICTHRTNSKTNVSKLEDSSKSATGNFPQIFSSNDEAKLKPSDGYARLPI